LRRGTRGLAPCPPILVVPQINSRLSSDSELSSILTESNYNFNALDSVFAEVRPLEYYHHRLTETVMDPVVDDVVAKKSESKISAVTGSPQHGLTFSTINSAKSNSDSNNIISNQGHNITNSSLNNYSLSSTQSQQKNCTNLNESDSFDNGNATEPRPAQQQPGGSVTRDLDNNTNTIPSSSGGSAVAIYLSLTYQSGSLLSLRVPVANHSEASYWRRNGVGLTL